MLQANFVREQRQTVVNGLVSRGWDNTQTQKLCDEIIDLDDTRRKMQNETDTIKAAINKMSGEIGALMKAGKKDEAESQKSEVGKLKDQLKDCEQKMTEAADTLDVILMDIPNIPHSSVPIGKDEHDNLEVRRWGTTRVFDFEVKDHVDIGEGLNGLDFETAAKISGARFAIMRGGIARLHRAIAQFMLNTQTEEHGYIEHYTPYIVNTKTLLGTGQLPKFKDDMFSVRKGGDTEGEDLYLISTSEISMTNIVRDEILSADMLPLRMTAHTPCFRSEAGSYGRDTRGMIRQHQFDKVEMVQISHPDNSYKQLEEMTGHAETILQKLGLPYRVMLLCTGDMGFGSTKTYDLEVWLPSQNTFREISSCSNCEAFQARRMNARFKDGVSKPQHVHTLNGSGLAVGRTLVAVLENYQNADGSVTIPDILRPYMGGLKKIELL